MRLFLLSVLLVFISLAFCIYSSEGSWWAPEAPSTPAAPGTPGLSSASKPKSRRGSKPVIVEDEAVVDDPDVEEPPPVKKSRKAAPKQVTVEVPPLHLDSQYVYNKARGSVQNDEWIKKMSTRVAGILDAVQKQGWAAAARPFITSLVDSSLPSVLEMFTASKGPLPNPNEQDRKQKV
jgi:hypothetical protein